MTYLINIERHINVMDGSMAENEAVANCARMRQSSISVSPSVPRG
jgi:hypothetical protein